MSKHLDSIEFTFENVEYYTIPSKYVISLYVNDLRKDLELQADGEVTPQMTCTTLALCFKHKEVNKQSTFTMDASGRPLPLGDRIDHFRDITFMSLNYDDGSYCDIKLPWNFRSETVNENMFVKINQRYNKESLLVSSDEDILRNHSFWLE